MIISIDVGEKNFAYCIGDLDRVYSWKCHNVMKKKNQTVIESCMMISDIMEHEKGLIDQCSAVVIEQQMLGNVRAQRVAQHIWSWCTAKYPCKPCCSFRRIGKHNIFWVRTSSIRNNGKSGALKKFVISSRIEMTTRKPCTMR